MDEALDGMYLVAGGGGTSQYPHFSEDLQFPPRYLGPHTGPQMVTLGRTEH